MVARLARAPIPWREFRIVLALAPLVAFGAWAWWARQPVGPPVRTSARIVSVTFIPAGKNSSAGWNVEAELADGKRTFLSLVWERPHQCKVGDTIDIFVTPARIGKPGITIGPKGCG